MTVTGSRQSMVVDLGSDAPTPRRPGRRLYHGGDTGSHVANPDALCIKAFKYRQSTNYRQTLLLYVHFIVVSEYAIVIHV